MIRHGQACHISPASKPNPPALLAMAHLSNCLHNEHVIIYRFQLGLRTHILPDRRALKCGHLRIPSYLMGRWRRPTWFAPLQTAAGHAFKYSSECIGRAYHVEKSADTTIWVMWLDERSQESVLSKKAALRLTPGFFWNKQEILCLPTSFTSNTAVYVISLLCSPKRIHNLGFSCAIT